MTLAQAVVFDSLQMVKPVPIVAKDFLPLIATDNDVINALRIPPVVSWPRRRT